MNKQKWIQCALDKGFESFEIYQSGSSERSLSWFEGEMDSFVTSNVVTTSLRGVFGGKMANYSTEDTDDSLMESIIGKMAEQAAAVTSEDVEIIRKPEQVESLSQGRKWVRPGSDEILKLLASLEAKIAAYDPRVFQVTFVDWQEEKSSRSIANSYGIDLADENNIQIIYAGVAVREGEDIKDDYNYELVYDINEFDEDAFVKKLCDGALLKLNATALTSGTYPVILEKDAMTSLMMPLSRMFSGELIGKGISPLKKDQLGETLFSELITIVDDPMEESAVNRAAFDDEGCPTKRKLLVENGHFTGILHNSKSAARMGEESTGNGFKSPFTSSIEVSPKNLFIKGGEASLDELCARMGEGFVIMNLEGLHVGIDFITTNFSLQCSGYWVKDGKRDHSVTLVTAAGNFLELMKKVKAVGNDGEWKLGSISCPSILFEGLAISG